MNPIAQFFIFLAELAAFCWGANIIYEMIVSEFIKITPKKEIIKTTCEGCGCEFDYPLHNHFGYYSCSKDCDDFLDEIFTEMN